MTDQTVKIALLGAVLPWMDEQSLVSTVDSITEESGLTGPERDTLRERLLSAGRHARQALDERIERHIAEYVGQARTKHGLDVADLSHRVTELEIAAAKTQKAMKKAARAV